MPRVVIAVRRQGQPAETDFEVPTDVGAAILAEQLATALGPPIGQGSLELRSVSLGRALRPDETLADLGLWDGAILVLARSSDPVEIPRGGALAVAEAPASLAVLPIPAPPFLAVPPLEQGRRPILPIVLLAAGVLVVLAAAGLWWMQGRSASAPAVVAGATAAPTVEPTSALSVAQSPAVTPAAPDEEAAWRELQGRLDLLWGDDWQATISLLQTFHTQYPTRTAATDKLYAALVEYGRALRTAGETSAAGDAFQQAIRLQPQRIEARTELAAMAPEATPTVEPTPVPPPTIAQAPPPPAPLRAPTTVPVVVPQQPQQPEQAPTQTCNVRSVDNACPLGDGSHVEETIDVPAGRHFYWFGVPQPGMQLRVQASGPACPCTLWIFSDAVDNGQTPIASGGTGLDQNIADPGPYVLEVAPAQDGNEPELGYTLDVGLREAPPAETPVEPPAPPPVEPVVVQPVVVPPVVARSANEANDRMRAAGLEPLMQTADRYSPGGPGTVAVQDPPAGTSLAPGGTVTLLIASGNVVVPAVVGLFEQDATTMLSAEGLDVAIRHAPSSSVEAGRVAGIDVTPGLKVPAGSRVTLTISLGR